MDTVPVAPVGSVVAPAAIADRGSQQRRKKRDAEDDQESHKAEREKPTEERTLSCQQRVLWQQRVMMRGILIAMGEPL